jgi:antitoxin CptB
MDPTTHSRLRWRCRRGMLELDQLMLRWLDREGPTASSAQLVLFERLLDIEDDQLWRWCMRREQPQEQELHELVERILALPA